MEEYNEVKVSTFKKVLQVIANYTLYEVTGVPKVVDPKVRLFNFLCFLNAFVNLFGSFPLIFFNASLLLVAFNLVTCLLFFSFWFMSRYGNVSKSKLILPFILTVLGFLLVSQFYDSGTMGGTHYYFILAAAIFIVVADDWIESLLALILSMLSVAALFYLEHFYPELFLFEQDSDLVMINRMSNYLFVLVMVFVIVLQLRFTLVLENKYSEAVLYNIMPAKIASELRMRNKVAPLKYDHATIVFLDLCGFSHLVKLLPIDELFRTLGYYFDKFDSVFKKHNIEKIKSIGDGYLAVGGIPEINDTHPFDAMRACISILEIMNSPEERKIREEQGIADMKLRIGLHTGSLIAGVLGVNKFSYDVWGHDVNLASRLESTGLPDAINISEEAYKILGDTFPFKLRGKLPVKNLGEINIYVFDIEKYYHLISK